MKPVTAEACLERTLALRMSLAAAWNALRSSWRKIRCRLIHRSISLPVHGRYRCWTCFEEFDTDF